LEIAALDYHDLLKVIENSFEQLFHHLVLFAQ